MPARSALVLTIDALHSGFLGAYGNTWVETPEFDALAAESFVFDQAMIFHPRCERVFDALWTVRAAPAVGGQPLTAALARVLNDAGIATCLLTDDPAVAAHPLAAAFAERILFRPDEPHVAAPDMAQTALAQTFAAAAERLSTVQNPFLLWVHVRGMAAPWDAPYELREQYADPEDPAPPNFVAVPDQRLAEDHHPDELLGIVHAYAGQVSLFDACLGVIREALVESPEAAATLFCLLGARSFPLGEHGRIGGDDAPLYSELLQIPWMLRFPDGLGALERSSALVQQQDLPATLLGWWQLGTVWPAPGSHDLLPLVCNEQQSIRDRVYVAASPSEQVLRTPAWFLRATGCAAAPRLELFAKPSDRWDVNQVADRVPDVADQLNAALVECPLAGVDAQFAPLDPRLVEPLD